MASSYSIGNFPRLTGKYGVGVFDVLPSLNDEEPLLIKLYYPTERKVDEVPQSQLALYTTSESYRYRKSSIQARTNSAFVSKFLAAPVAYGLSVFSGESWRTIQEETMHYRYRTVEPTSRRNRH